jgi:endonuclease/exonuclease/phosphatase family metal-dependent hydrolase
MPRGSLKILNWNIAGAKYLELRSKESKTNTLPENTREAFRKRLNEALKKLIETHEPDVITLQEVCRYEDGKDRNPHHVIDAVKDYEYFPHWLIDTQHHSATGKWDKVRAMGEWAGQAFFAQGNAILIKKNIPHFRPFDLPAIGQEPDVSLPRDRIEVVKLESGLYLGDRNTEPRAGLVAHLVLSQLHNGKSYEKLERPIDIFVVNLHLTTLMKEREGIPELDSDGSQIRMRQLDIVFNGIVSRYNKWKKDDFRIRGEHIAPKQGETHTRHSPIWVIAGDFNFTRESAEYHSVIQRGFIDMIQNHQIGTKTSGLGENPTLTVDYVFAGPSFEAIDPGIARDETVQNHVEVNPQTRISDHFPLIIDVPIYLENR